MLWGTLGSVTPYTHGSGSDRHTSFCSIVALLDPGWLLPSLSSPAQPPGLLALVTNQTQAQDQSTPPLTGCRAQRPEGFCRACLELNKVEPGPSQ